MGLRDVAGEGDHEGEGVFCGRDGIPSWGIHDDDAGGRGGGHIDVVDADAGAADGFELSGFGEDLGGDLGLGADDDAVVFVC